MEGPTPSCSHPNGWRLLINIDGVFTGMAVRLNYSEGFRETYGPGSLSLSTARLTEHVNTYCGPGEAEEQAGGGGMCEE